MSVIEKLQNMKAKDGSCGCAIGLGRVLSRSWSRSAKNSTSHSTVEQRSSCVARDWSSNAADYDLVTLCGKGACASVWRAVCKHNEAPVAIKVMRLDDGVNLAAIVSETSQMRGYNHPNILPLLTSFVKGDELWMVLPYMSLGSVRSIAQQHFPQGVDEVVLATLAKEVLKGLAYVHQNGAIHRDIKADNILVGKDGSVVLADFGVAATMTRQVSLAVNKGDQEGRHTTMVGTPCWMAPEVVANADGYGAEADVWSFGITLMELAQGVVPRARMNPLRVFMITVQAPSPVLEDDPATGRVYSKALKEVVNSCLTKDPTLRVTASELLNHRFFKKARDKEYLKKHFLAGQLGSGGTSSEGGSDDAVKPRTPNLPFRLFKSAVGLEGGKKGLGSTVMAGPVTEVGPSGGRASRHDSGAEAKDNMDLAR